MGQKFESDKREHRAERRTEKAAALADATSDTTAGQDDGPTGLDLRAVLIRSSRHALARTCDCGEDLTTTAIVRLAYTFRVCECGTPEYDHLVEQLWHLDCLRGSS